MRPTEILKSEHRIIEQVLECFQRLLGKFQPGNMDDIQNLRDMVYFFRTFTDACHHGKEEGFLFPTMEKKGFSPEHGPTAVMRSEHEEGRQLIKGIADYVQAESEERLSRKDFFLETGWRYISFLREHIRKEDLCLFPMADEALTEQEQEQLVENFIKVEHQDMPEGAHEMCVEIADRLAKHFGVMSSTSVTGRCCCKHDAGEKGRNGQ